MILIGCESVPAEFEDKNQPKHINGIRLLSQPSPRYPVNAASKGVQGCVTVLFGISPDGKTLEPEILESNPKGVFDQVTLDAINNYAWAKQDKVVSNFHTVRYTHIKPINPLPKCNKIKQLLTKAAN